MSPSPFLPDAPAPPAPPEAFRRRREALLDRIGGGVAIVGAAPELVRSRDTEVPYRPSTDLYYLTGFEEPGAVAVLSPHDAERRFTLFVRPRDPDQEVWNGPRAGPERARAQTGADAAHPIDELDELLPDLVRPADRIVYPIGADAGLDRRILEGLARARRARARSGEGPTGVEDLEAVLGELRRVKDADELHRMRGAAAIAAAGHRAVLRRAGPGVGEWELQAVLEAAFRRHGATGAAFPSIVASGPNATVLHYTRNSRRMQPGELVLVDAGAEWGMYCSDITRTFPVSGRFTAAQRALYELVLAAEEAGIAAARPGAEVAAVHDAAVRVLVRGMLDLELLPGSDEEEVIESGAHRRFYMHQTSHWLGLDVHDVGTYREKGEPVVLRPGMVLTVEPGLYLPANDLTLPEGLRGVGIRIEDSILITDRGAEPLTRDVPVAPDEVEALIGRG